MGKKRYEMQPSSSTGEVQEDKFNMGETLDDVAYIASGQRDLPMPTIGVEERVTPVSVVEEPKKKGRPKKGATLDLTVGINVFLDKPLHKKLQYARAETDISIKDLIYMATDYMMNELFDGSMPTKEGERVIRGFKEKMFGAED